MEEAIDVAQIIRLLSEVSSSIRESIIRLNKNSNRIQIIRQIYFYHQACSTHSLEEMSTFVFTSFTSLRATSIFPLSPN